MNLPSSPAASAGSSDLLPSLLDLLASKRPDADTRLITTAYETAAYWHQGQKRRSGDPYITHPVAVAAILADTGADDPTVCAALLHDIVDDTPYTLAAMRGKFGAEIAGLLEAIMALDMTPADQVAAACTDGAAAVALAGDERALVIKLADRLHNIRTLRHLPRAKQVLKSRQTLEVMVPLARTLQMDAISTELETLAVATLQRHGQRTRTASGRLLAATAALLPASARARWREEWLAELHVLATRRERITFAAQIVLGIGRLAVTLNQPGALLRQAFSAVLTAAVAASGLVVGGWKTAAAMAAAAASVLSAVMWVLGSDDRTRRLAQLICALRTAPPEDPHSQASRSGTRTEPRSNSRPASLR
jgi:HD domain